MPLHGVFIDPSEYRRNNFNFSGERLRALAGLKDKDWIELVQTDVSVSETWKLIREQIRIACEPLRKSKISPLKSIADDRLDVFRDFPKADELADKLIAQFNEYVVTAGFQNLSVSEVDPSVVFSSYFESEPPFDIPGKRKIEFPDAFTLHRLILWADQKNTTVYVVGPDDDLRRTCEVQNNLQYFEKIEALLHHINSADTLVSRLSSRPQELIERLGELVCSEFGNLHFILMYNDHGEVGQVDVNDFDIGEVYALSVGQNGVRAEAEVAVDFLAEFSYEDFDTGFYDKDTDQYCMTEYVEGEVEDRHRSSVRFDFSVGPEDTFIVSNFAFTEDTVAVEEEDRGDYGAYK